MMIRYALGLAVGVFVLLLLVGKRSELSAALRHLDHLNYAWETGAVLAEALSIVGYAYLQKRVLHWGGAGDGSADAPSVPKCVLPRTIPLGKAIAASAIFTA